MGLDMYMYNSKYTDINFEGEDDRCLYWCGQRTLHELFYMFGKRTEKEGYFIFTKEDVIRMVAYLMHSVMNIHKAAKIAYDDMMNAEDKELPTDVLHREYYVAGRILSKAFENELRYGHSFNAVNIFDDFDGTMMKDLINGLMKLLMEMKDDELITYLASY